MRALRFIAALVLVPSSLLAQDVLRGRVRGPDSLGIKNATVSVLPATAGATSRYVRTDSTGNWSLQMDGTAPTYTVTVTALGLAPQRVAAKRTGDGQPIVIDVVLKRAAVQLEAVTNLAIRKSTPLKDLTLPVVAKTTL